MKSRIGIATLRAVIVVIAVTAVGCAHRKETIFDDGKIKVVLRNRGQETVGLDHPVVIAAVRMNHILARIDIRTSAKDGQRRTAAIPLASLDVIAAAFVTGLAEAGPNQEVVVTSIRTEKRFGLFNQNYLTSFTGYQLQGVLFVHLSRSDWEIPPRREKRLPEPQIGEFPSKFRIVPSESMELIDQQSLAIDWRANLFDRPTRTRVTPSGKVVRRTILMESSDEDPAEEDDDALRPEILPIPPGVSPEVLRALADLEEQRRQGTISEALYAIRRLEILDVEESR